jgi:homoserine dehydrogenase
MTQEKMDFQHALAEAQGRGFAEADPTFDVEGIDAAHKLVILTALAYGLRIEMGEVFVEGIRRIEPVDIAFADEFGYIVKLLAISSRQGNEVEARLHPTMLPKRHLLADVGGNFNAVHLHGDAAGDILLYGQGAGMMPTASAVVGDLMELARNHRGGGAQRVPALGWRSFMDQGLRLKPMDEVVTSYYFRFQVKDRPGVLSRISGVLGENDISISQVIQKGRDAAGAVPIVMLTHEAREKDVRRALDIIDRLDVVLGKTMLIRVEDRL